MSTIFARVAHTPGALENAALAGSVLWGILWGTLLEVAVSAEPDSGVAFLKALIPYLPIAAILIGIGGAWFMVQQQTADIARQSVDISRMQGEMSSHGARLATVETICAQMVDRQMRLETSMADLTASMAAVCQATKAKCRW